MNEYERESNEHQPVIVTKNGAEVTVGFTVMDIPYNDRPEDHPGSWIAPVVLEGKPGVMTGGKQPGFRKVWVSVDGGSEQVVEVAGTYRIT